MKTVLPLALILFTTSVALSPPVQADEMAFYAPSEVKWKDGPG